MWSNKAFLLCLVSVFCDCNGLTTFGRSSTSLGKVHFYPRFPLTMMTTTELSTTSTDGKEYGKESKQFNEINEKKYVVFTTEKLNWDDAKDSCKTKGMILAAPSTYTEKRNLEEYLYESMLYPQDKFNGYWIGSRRFAQDDPWVWESSNQEVNNFGWLIGEPNGFDGENCMEWKRDDYLMGWNNFYCSALKGYICESSSYEIESNKNIIKDNKEKTLNEELKKGFPDIRSGEKITGKNDNLDNYSAHKFNIFTPTRTKSTNVLDHVDIHRRFESNLAHSVFQKRITPAPLTHIHPTWIPEPISYETETPVTDHQSIEATRTPVRYYFDDDDDDEYDWE